MRMRLSVRKRYLRVLLPAAGALLLLAFLLLWLSGFGFRYLFKKPAPLASLGADALGGAFVTVPVENVGENFAAYGYEDRSGNPVFSERYCVRELGGKYLVIRITQKDLPLYDRCEKAEELVLSGEFGSLREVDFGDLRGTLNPLSKSAAAALRGWLIEHQLDAKTLTDRFSGADLSDYPGAADGDFSAYLSEVILPWQLESGYLGARSGGAVKALSAAALILVVLALALLVSIFLGLWERPMRGIIRTYGSKEAENDFAQGSDFGACLRIGSRFLWAGGKLTTRVLELRDLVWVYPRSRRLEGGKKRWSFVMKTAQGGEAVVRIASEAEAEQAAACLLGRCEAITVGFDKEKQKLYKKDPAAFVARVRSGDI